MPSEPSLVTPIAIGIGAVPGALARFYLTLFCDRILGSHFPYGTFMINLSGAFAMGFLAAAIAAGHLPSTVVQRLITVGFIGSYTTFSTYTLDTVNLLRRGQRRRAAVYWAGSAILGMLSVEAGLFCGAWVS
ncbi:MAG: fluoride efflux transporter CrcB [Thermosynechococcaceae cyanobacterium]